MCIFPSPSWRVAPLQISGHLHTSARATDLVQDLLEAVERPIEIRARDDEGWGEPHDRLVRLLRQHALFQQTLAGLARARDGRIDFGAGPEAAAAHLLERRAPEP